MESIIQPPEQIRKVMIKSYVEGHFIAKKHSHKLNIRERKIMMKNARSFSYLTMRIRYKRNYMYCTSQKSTRFAMINMHINTYMKSGIFNSDASHAAYHNNFNI